jgi:hypothetical protein
MAPEMSAKKIIIIILGLKKKKNIPVQFYNA